MLDTTTVPDVPPAPDASIAPEAPAASDMLPALGMPPRAGVRPVRPATYKILSVLPDASACGYYRHALPAVHMAPALAARGIELQIAPAFCDERRYDAYIFSRTYAPRVFPGIVRLYEQGAKILWDLDDDLPTVPDWSPAKAAFGDTEIAFLRHYLSMASAVTCSTACLARSTESHFPATAARTHVLENLVDPRAYDAWPRREARGPTRVLWAGSKTHVADLELIAPLFDRILADGSVQLVFYGHCPDRYFGAPPERVLRIAPNDKVCYEPTLNLIGADIGLAPLVDCHFNRCKSVIKWLEYTLAGAATIASGVGPFADVMTGWDVGFLATTADHWDYAYDFLTHFPDSRRRYIRHAREAVLSSFSWASDSPRRRAWLDFFAAIPDLPVA